MPGPAPKEKRRRRNAPALGDWKPAPSSGWQHGPIPTPPDGLKEATRTAWQTWFTSWYAAFWTPDLLPGLRVIANLYDQVEREEWSRMPELRQMMDRFGMTPFGQQKLRWTPPKADEASKQEVSPNGRYAHLRAVS